MHFVLNMANLSTLVLVRDFGFFEGKFDATTQKHPFIHEIIQHFV